MAAAIMMRGDSFYPQLASADGNMDMIDPLLRLKDALEGAQKNTQRMINKLDRFERRLGDLDEKMQPIQESTEHYTRAKENISLTLVEVNKTYEYFRVAATVKEVIIKGITPATQKEYYDALVKLSYAKQFFESHREIKSSTSVLASIDDLLTKAVTACTAEFERLLGTVGVAAAMVDGQYQVISPMTPEVARQLKSLCDTFESSKASGYLKIYQTARASVCRAELKQLETSSLSAWNAQLSEDPYDKGSHPFAEHLSLSYWLLRGEFQLWGSTLPSDEDSLSCYTSICDAFVADLSRVLGPFIADDKTRTVNPVTRQCKLLLLRLDLLSALNTSYEEYRDICHPDARHESTASLALKALRLSVLSASMRSMEYLLSPAMSEGFEKDKKKDKADEASSSCDLHPVTGNLLYCCKELLASFAAPYRRMHEVAGAAGIAVNVPVDLDEGVSALLENLFVALESRAEKYDEAKTKALRRSLAIKNHNLFEMEDKAAEDMVMSARKHLFLSNNYYAMWNYTKDKRDDGSSAQTMRRGVAGRNPRQRIALLAEKVESRCSAEQELFCETIAMALGLGTQDMAEFTTMYAKDKAGQFRLLKAKFCVFNTGLEALLAQQGEWRVSSSGLRDSLSQQLTNRILPTYSSFFSSYSGVRFSKKHMTDYVRFTPQAVEAHLRSFFGRAG